MLSFVYMPAPKNDPEVEAMGTLAGALDPLEPEAAGRVLRWAAERYGVTMAPARGKTKHQNGGGSDFGGETPGDFAELSDLVSAASPATDEDRALVVAYWFQDGQEEKQPDVSGQQVNKELKNLGHGVKDITKVFSSLIATSPQQVIQTRKSGTSRQARKRYKVTKAGIARVQELLAA
jgi:hypothetical protein